MVLWQSASEWPYARPWSCALRNEKRTSRQAEESTSGRVQSEARSSLTHSVKQMGVGLTSTTTTAPPPPAASLLLLLRFLLVLLLLLLLLRAKSGAP